MNIPEKSTEPTKKTDTSEPSKPLPTDTAGKTAARKNSGIVRLASRTAGVIILILLAGGILAYTATPAVIRRPAVQHYHFRMQLITDGKAVNFAGDAFQEGYSKDNCNTDLTAQPFHFHDQRDQMVHVHWDDMTGGLLLKFYGWNYTGGLSGTLGYRFDKLPKVTSVPIHGQVLPKPATGDKFYVYTGDKDGYRERSWDDFLKQDFETFFNKKSNLGDEGSEQTGWLNRLFPKAYAHGNERHDASDTLALSEDELKIINNLLGNVVIFAQKDKPDDTQIKERFDHLAPLEASACAG